MLYFKSDEELFAELESINKMNDEEKSEWEKSKGFEPFGLTADKFYQSIDPSRFRSIDEVKKFVKDNSKYLQLVEEENGELVLETVLGGSPFRYLANDDGIILVDNFLLKIYDNVALSVDKCCYD